MTPYCSSEAGRKRLHASQENGTREGDQKRGKGSAGEREGDRWEGEVREAGGRSTFGLRSEGNVWEQQTRTNSAP